VEFPDNRAATKALLMLNGTNVAGTNKYFKLNWASGGGLTDKKYILITMVFFLYY
jgi:hypothetical protein